VSPDDIRELFCAFGNVTVRRMFGGAGLYLEATMFALMHDGVIYLKADDHNADAFERESLPPFTYTTKAGKRGVMSYRRMPERLYDDPEELAVWACEALAVARRGAMRKPARSSSHAATGNPLRQPVRQPFKQPSGRGGAPPNRSRK
jgi:DNA transformation protein and related proteins